MTLKKWDLNRFRKSYSFVRIGLPQWIYHGDKYLGYASASITEGAEEFVGRFGAAPQKGPPFIPLTVTLTQDCGTFGFCRLDLSGTSPGSFQLIAVDGHSVGPYDLDSAIANDLLAMGWEGDSTSFTINVKPGIAYGSHTAIITITDFDGTVVRVLNLSASVEDLFMNAALATTSAKLLAAWSPTPNGVKSITTSTDTMTALTSSNIGQTATATDVDGGSPAIVATSFTSYSLATGIQNDGGHSVNNTLASPLTALPGTDFRGSWFLVFQGESVSDTAGNQADMFFFQGYTGPWFPPPVSYLKKQGVVVGVSNDYMFHSLDFDTAPPQLPTDPATTVSIALARNIDGEISFYSQEAGSATIATPTTGQMDMDTTDDFWGSDPSYPARFELKTSNSGEPLEFTLLAVLIYDDKLSAADISDINAAVV